MQEIKTNRTQLSPLELLCVHKFKKKLDFYGMTEAIHSNPDFEGVFGDKRIGKRATQV
ncbi:MAG: hypothetical protein JWR38_3432, partial [Mucilaginibacter sp.]|nr:hypothetical protein [Mucilaginibacter sp.]